MRKYLRPLAQNTTSTTPYYNPDAMAHVLLKLNEPLLQRSKARGPLGLSLTTKITPLFVISLEGKYQLIWKL